MNLKWLNKITLPVLAMLFVYYAQSSTVERLNGINSVNTINQQLQVARGEVTAQTHHIIYGLYNTNHVVRTYVEQETEAGMIESIFNILTVNANQLPEGVTSLIPENAELINYTLEDGNLTLNLSKSFLDYAPEDERQILSALVWTYTELSEVDNVMFEIEGTRVSNLNSSLSVGRGLTRSMGLNLEVDTNLTDLNDSKLVMLYFLTNDSSEGFLVPVTRLVSAQTDVVTYAIESLIAGPRNENYISIFNHRTTLLDDPVLEDGLLTLNFSSDLYYNRDQTKVSSVLMRQLIMTLTELDEIENVSVIIEGNVRVFDDELNPIAIPTSRHVFDAFIEAH